MESTYNILTNCSNCTAQNSLEIPKGTTIQDYLATGPLCSNCGCKISG